MEGRNETYNVAEACEAVGECVGQYFTCLSIFISAFRDRAKLLALSTPPSRRMTIQEAVDDVQIMVFW